MFVVVDGIADGGVEFAAHLEPVLLSRSDDQLLHAVFLIDVGSGIGAEL